MKTRFTEQLIAGLVVSSMCALTACDQGAPETETRAAPEMKMTTPVPPGVATPDSVETRLGTLRFTDGFPDDATIEKVLDNLDFQRGVQSVLASIPAASLHAMREGLRTFGPDNTSAVIFEQLMDSSALFLTANASSVYCMLWLDVKNGPMVIETPPDVLGIIDDAWFHYVADFGRVGPDEGKGGKFLILPPGYDGDVPGGYHVADRPAVPESGQSEGRCRDEPGHVGGYLLRARSTTGQGEQLDPDGSRQRVEHHSSTLWPVGALVRQDVATG